MISLSLVSIKNYNFIIVEREKRERERLTRVKYEMSKFSKPLVSSG